jgi:tetratricopeptide (TPR) repeat protein
MMDVRQQVASVLRTKVEVSSEELLRKEGSEARGSDRILQARYRSEIRTTVAEHVRAVLEEAFYWEKWKVDPGLFARAFIRYKYFVLASYPKAEYERNLNYFTALVAGEQRADELIDEGKPKEAAKLLEGLLDRYPKASVPIRLKLADACQHAGMLDRAEGVLDVALKLSSEAPERARIRERINQLKQAFPDLSGNSVYVIVDLGESGRRDIGVVTSWITEPFVLSRVQPVAVEVGSWDTPSSKQIASAKEGGANWLAMLRLRQKPSGATREVYGAALHEARSECSVHVFSTEDGKLLATGSSLQRGLASTPDQAARDANKFALRTALRQCLLALVER